MAKIAFPPQRGAFIFPQRGAFSWWFVKGLPHSKSCFFHSAERLVGGFPFDRLVPNCNFSRVPSFLLVVCHLIALSEFVDVPQCQVFSRCFASAQFLKKMYLTLEPWKNMQKIVQYLHVDVLEDFSVYFSKV